MPSVQWVSLLSSVRVVVGVIPHFLEMYTKLRNVRTPLPPPPPPLLLLFLIDHAKNVINVNGSSTCLELVTFSVAQTAAVASAVAEES